MSCTPCSNRIQEEALILVTTALRVFHLPSSKVNLILTYLTQPYPLTHALHGVNVDGRHWLVSSPLALLDLTPPYLTFGPKLC